MKTLFAVLCVAAVATFAAWAQPAQPTRYRVVTVEKPEARTVFKLLTLAQATPEDPRQALMTEYPRPIPNGTPTHPPSFVDMSGRMFCAAYGVLLAECEVVK
jgi:hypothetical protein